MHLQKTMTRTITATSTMHAKTTPPTPPPIPAASCWEEPLSAAVDVCRLSAVVVSASEEDAEELSGDIVAIIVVAKSVAAVSVVATVVGISMKGAPSNYIITMTNYIREGCMV